MCDLGKGESSGGVVRTLRGQPRSARWGRAAGRGSGGDGSPAPRRRRKAAHANPRGWGLKAGPRAPLGSRQGASCEAATWGGAGGETRHFPTPPPRGAAAATELLGLIQVRRWGRDRRGCLSCFLSCCCPCRRRGRGPHPTPPQRGSSRGQNEASCGPASCRRACSGPAPSAERRGQLWLAHPHSPAVSQLSLAASVSAFLCVGSVPDSENYLP